MNVFSVIFQGSLMQRCLVILAVVSLSACTASGVDESLSASTQTIQQAPSQSAQVATTDAANTVAETAANANAQITAAEAAANNTVTNALSPTQPDNPTGTVAQNQLQQQSTSQASAQQVASLDTSKSITFLPFEGAPAFQSNVISRFLNSTAVSNGLSVLPATRAGAKYNVKGYFSALTDGNGTLLVYVWDVTDGTGKRLHRINGRERSGSTSTDPWQAISDEELERVADATTASLKTWIDRQS